ncbi:cation diffusion facilitator family transporter [Robertkochia sediminum]|uniref:cation diffusion facilitator family transporter n=1 Tax=Robertkochia sediminum TaxID=2785326 RepID=UPI001933CBB6|nr:cation diffusion facilitator family transporter [Robertkochia sediminum]MBL7471464.1 cation transporter [Robertkochia sediminum]
MGHGHSHDHGAHQPLKGKNLLISILLNICITLAQVIGGLISGSLALLSDALHNATDVISLIISYVANRLARTKASTHRTFGYKRAEIIAAFINAVSLIVIAIILIAEAYKRILDPQPIGTGLVIWLAILGIVANGLSVLILKKDAGRNINMRSAYLHLLTDMMASVAVLIGGLLMKFFGIYWIDSVLTFLIGLYLIYVGYDLLRSSTRMLMLFTPDHIDVKALVRSVHQLEDVNKLHHIHVWGLNDDELHLEAHLDFKKDITLSRFNEILAQIETILKEEYGINHVNIQPEFNKEDPKDYIVQD